MIQYCIKKIKNEYFYGTGWQHPQPYRDRKSALYESIRQTRRTMKILIRFIFYGGASGCAF